MRVSKNLNEKIMAFSPVIFFLILTMCNLNYPGISIDEAGDGIISSYIFKDITNYYFKPELMIVSYYIILFNKILPIMQHPYVGTVFSYLVLPFSLIFGLNVTSLRITPIFFSALTILFIYFSCKIWFNKKVAFLASLLTATNLLFVQYSRVGLHREEIFIIFFFWAGLFFLAKYSDTKRTLFLYLSLYFWGLGISSKITFLWYIAGITIAYAILHRRANLSASLNIRQSIIAALSFCFGAIFVVLYNIEEPWITLRILTQSFFISPFKQVPHIHINNLAYLTNLKVRLPHLIMLLKGDIIDRIDWGIIKTCFIERISSLTVSLAFASFVAVLIFTLFSRNKTIKYKILFFYIVYMTIVVLMPFTTSGFHPGHLVVLLPFPQIVMALFLNYVWEGLRYKRIPLIIIYSTFLIPAIIFNVWMNIHFNIEMKKNGGYRRWSTAVYELADYLDKKDIQPIMFGWGLKENIAFLSEERIVPVIYDETEFTLEEFAQEYNRLSLKKEPIFYLTMMSEESPSFLNLFMKLIKDDGKKKTIEKIFLNRAGDKVYWLYKIY